MTTADLKHGLELMRQASRAAQDFTDPSRAGSAERAEAAERASNCEFRLSDWLREHGENLFAAAADTFGIKLPEASA